jgi:hypothetical protein
MTTDPATGGPLSPIPGDAGRFVVYRTGDVIVCPGERLNDRRTQPRQDRRQRPRVEPCPGTWGRVVGARTVAVRLKPHGTSNAALLGQLVECPRCRQVIQIVQDVATNEAA